MCDWAAYMEKQLQEQHRTNWTEISAAELLRQFRLQQENSRGESFGTISAYGANGAIIHYAPTPETDAQLGEDSLYMVDSGGQYLEGTTDVTRTFHYGLPTAEMVTRYMYRQSRPWFASFGPFPACFPAAPGFKK